MAIRKLRVLCRLCSSFKASELVVMTMLALFSIQNLGIILCLCFEFLYVKHRKLIWSQLVNIFHIVASIGFVGLLIFIAVVIIELSREKPESLNTESNSKLNFVARLKTNEALNQYIRREHSRQSTSDIQEAFKAYEELVAK
jgi:hypothetical protein